MRHPLVLSGRVQANFHAEGLYLFVGETRIGRLRSEKGAKIYAEFLQSRLSQLYTIFRPSKKKAPAMPRLAVAATAIFGVELKSVYCSNNINYKTIVADLNRQEGAIKLAKDLNSSLRLSNPNL